MKIGIGSSAYFDLYNTSEGFEKLKRHGFEAVNCEHFVNTENELFKLDDAAFDKALSDIRAEAEKAGIEICQTHGPWRWPPRDTTEEDRAERFEKMSRSLHGTAVLGCKYCVVHPIMPFGVQEQPDPDKLIEMNVDYYSRLSKVAERENVVICLENMPFPLMPTSRGNEILSLIKAIDSPWVRGCIDTGHCAVCGESPADAVRLWGTEYLKVLHVHDNNGQRDLHMLPYYGVIDWEDFRSALHEIGFDGVLMIETSVPKKMPKMPIDVREYHERGLAIIARSLT